MNKCSNRKEDDTEKKQPIFVIVFLDNRTFFFFVALAITFILKKIISFQVRHKKYGFEQYKGGKSFTFTSKNLLNSINDYFP